MKYWSSTGLALWLLASWAQAAAWYDLPRPQEAKARLAGLEAAIARQPADAGLRFDAAKILHFFENKQQAALVHLQAACHLRPDHVPTWHLRGLVESVQLDFAAALRSSLHACRADPGHPAAENSVRRVGELFGRVKGYNELVRPVLEGVYADARLRSPLMRDAVRATLELICQDTGDGAARGRFLKDAGFVDDWLVIGPFGKFPVVSMAHPFQPETEDQPQKRYVRHEAMAGSGREHVMPRADRFPDEPVRRRGRPVNGVVYFVTYVKADQPVDVIARVQSVFSLKLFVNRRLMLDSRWLWEWQPAVHHVGMRLASGWNKIVVKLLCTAHDSPSFTLRLLQLDGTRAGLEARAKLDACPSVAEQPAAQAVTPRLGAISEFRTICASRPRPAWPALMLAQLEVDRLHLERAKELFLDAREALPSYALACFALGDLVQADPSLHRGVARSRSREWYRKALELWPDAAAAWHRLAMLDVQDDLAVEALNKLAKCVEARPTEVEWQPALLGIYEAKGWDREARNACLRVQELLPDSALAAKLMLQYWIKRGVADPCLSVAREVVAHEPDSQALAMCLENARRHKLAEAEYRRLVQLHPSDVGLIHKVARVQQKLGRVDEAQEGLRKLLELAGPSRSVYQHLAQLQLMRGDRPAAMRSMRRAFREQPSSLRLQRALCFLGDPDPTEPFAVTYDDVMADKARHDRPHPEAEAAYLLDQAVVAIEPDGSSCERVHCIIKVYDKKGVERWGEISLPAGADILELRTIKPDGTILEPEIIPYKRTYSMSGLSPEDVVEFEYLATEGRSFFPGCYQGPVFSFQDERAAMEASQYIAIVPQHWKLAVDRRQAAPEATTSLLRGHRVHRWEARAVAHADAEPNSVPREEFLPSVRFSHNITWHDVRDQFVSEVAGQLRRSYELDKVVAEIAAKHANARARLQAAYDYVNTHIVGEVSPAQFGRSASATLSLGKGNRLAVLKALLDGLGVQADVVRIASRIGPEISRSCPDLDGSTFNSAVLRTHVDAGKGSEVVWVDTLYRHLPLGYLLPAHRASWGVVVAADAREPLVRSPEQPDQKDLVVTRADIELGIDGDVTAKVREVHHGLFAVASRLQYQRAKPEQRKHAFERLLTQRFHRATLTRFELRDLEDCPRPLAFQYEFEASRFLRLDGNRGVMRVGFHPLWPGRRYAATRTRRTPILVASPIAWQSVIRITMPAGVSVDVPQDVAEKTDFGQIHYTYRVDGRVLIAERRIALPVQRVPVESYRKFAALVRRVDREDVREIGLKVDPGALPKKAEAPRARRHTRGG